MTPEKAKRLIAEARTWSPERKARLRRMFVADRMRKLALADTGGAITQAMELPPAERLALAHKLLADAQGGSTTLPKTGMPARRGMIF